MYTFCLSPEINLIVIFDVLLPNYRFNRILRFRNLESLELTKTCQGAPLFADPPPANSIAKDIRLVCQDRHLFLGGTAHLPSLSKPPSLLNQQCYFKILQDLDCRKAVHHSLCNDCSLPFRLEGAVKAAEERCYLLSDLINDNSGRGTN